MWEIIFDDALFEVTIVNLILKYFPFPINTAIPHSPEFLKRYTLSGGTQCRALPLYQSKEMKILNIILPSPKETHNRRDSSRSFMTLRDGRRPY